MIVLLLLALIVAVSLASVWLGLRFLARGVGVSVDHGPAGKGQLSIKTPVGSLEVGKDVDESRLGLPIYPGAQRMKDQDSANLSLSFGGEADLRLFVATFETPDPLEKVRDFYKQRLGGDVTQFVEKDRQGKTVFEIKRTGQERVVALETRSGGTRIALVRVNHGPPGAN
jgi:hypothetical protein